MNVVLSVHENILNQCGVGKKGTVFKLYSYSGYLSCLIEVNVGLIRGKWCTMYSMIEDITYRSLLFCLLKNVINGDKLALRKLDSCVQTTNQVTSFLRSWEIIFILNNSCLGS